MTFSAAEKVFFIITVLLASFYLIDDKTCLVVFGGLLFAISLSQATSWLAEQLRWGYRLVLVLVLLSLLLIFSLFLAFLYPSIATQLQEFFNEVPELSKKAMKFAQQQWGLPSFGSMFDIEKISEHSGMLQNLGGRVFKWLGGAFGALSSTVGLVFLALFLAFEPKTYQSGFRSIFPKDLHESFNAYFHKLGLGLSWWLVGRLGSMLTVGVLTTIGLSLLGIKNALAFGFITAILSFVPLIGPLLSIIPPLAVSLAQQSSVSVLSIIALFLFIQFIESYLITPFIQKRATSLPPALGLLSILIFSKFSGILGTIMATPIAVFLMVLVKSRNHQSQKYTSS